jgi:hypothetical protein
MKAMVAPTITYIGHRSETETRLRRSRTNWLVMMLLIGAAAVGSGVTGLFLWAVAWELPGSGFSPTATILLAISLPLFFFMAHCMDKIGKFDKAIRLNHCRRHGLNDADR